MSVSGVTFMPASFRHADFVGRSTEMPVQHRLLAWCQAIGRLRSKPNDEPIPLRKNGSEVAAIDATTDVLLNPVGTRSVINLIHDATHTLEQHSERQHDVPVTAQCATALD